MRIFVNKQPVIGLVIVIAVGLVWLNRFLFNLDKTLSLSGTDPSLASFILKHYMNTVFSGNWQEIATLPMFYGLKYSLFLSDHHFLFAIMALPIFVITGNIIFTTNLLSALGVIFSLCSMYIFAYYVTKNVIASIFSSVIYVFNPYIASHFPDHLILIWTGWIPLIFLYLEKLLINPSSKNSILFFLFLTFQLLSSLYYSAFLTVILPIYLLIRNWQSRPKINKFLNKGFLTGGIFFTTAVLVSIYFYSLSINEARNFVYEKDRVKIPEPRNMEITENYSPHVIDLLLDPLRKNILQSLIFKNIFFSKERQEHVNEKIIFIGFVPLSLLILSIVKLKEFRLFYTYFLIAVISIILSLGPPAGLYKLLYEINPLFHYLRAPGRIAIFSFFFIGLTLALLFKKILVGSSDKLKIILCFLVFLTFMEYFYPTVKYSNITDEQRQFYEILNSQKQINVIIDLPLGIQTLTSNGLMERRNVDSDYLLWATTLHSKKLFNGTSGFYPNQYFHFNRLYLETEFPSKRSIKVLKKSGVEGIVLHKDEYSNPGEFNLTVQGLLSLGIKEVVTFENLSLFDLTSF